MRPASTLLNPTKYFEAYTEGKKAAEAKKIYDNPYYNGFSSIEESDGFFDGYDENKA